MNNLLCFHPAHNSRDHGNKALLICEEKKKEINLGLMKLRREKHSNVSFHFLQALRMQRMLTSAGSVYICFISFPARCTLCICSAGMCLGRRTPLTCCLCSFCVSVTVRHLWLTITSCSPRGRRAFLHLLFSSSTI